MVEIAKRAWRDHHAVVMIDGEVPKTCLVLGDPSVLIAIDKEHAMDALDRMDEAVKLAMA